MPKLDYSFLDQDEEKPAGLLDYSFLSEPVEADDEPGGYQSEVTGRDTESLYAGEEPTNVDRVGSRLANMAAKSTFGLAEIAAQQKDDSGAELAGDVIDKTSVKPGEKPGFIDALTVPSATARTFLDYVSGMAAKGYVDIADMFTDSNVRDDIKAANTVVRQEADKALGSRELQYTGSEIEKFGYEVAEGMTNMAPALAVGWLSRNPGMSLGMIGGQVAGNTYSDYMAKTGDHDRAVAAAQFNVLAEVIPETIPVMAFLRRAKAGQGLSRFLEASLGEGGQEMLTEILQSTYDDVQLENMSLKEAIANIDWQQVRHAGLLGLAVGTGLSVPGTIADINAAAKGFDQDGSPGDLFNPTHKAGGGQDVQPVTRKGKIVPDTYITADGDVIRDSNAVENAPGAYDPSFDVNATVGAVKEEIESGKTAAPEPLPTVEEIIDQGPVVGESSLDISQDADRHAWGPGPEPPIGIARANITPKPEQPQTELPGDSDVIAEIDSKPAKGAVDSVVQADAVAPADEISAAAHEASTSKENALVEPTEAQKEAGNYKKGHIKVQGLDIAVENPAGSKRRPEWPTLKQHYGYIKRTVGADSKPGAKPHEVEQVDVFVKPDADIAAENSVFIIDQATEDGQTFDEHKIMMGFDSEQEAREAYLANYTKDWKGLKQITEATPEEFKDWLDKGDQAVEYAESDTTGAVESETASEQTQTDVSHETSKPLRPTRQEAAAKRTRENLQPRSDTDDVITFVRKLGGIDVDTESDVRGRLSHLNQENRTFGLPGIEQKGGKGMTLDMIGERLIEAGYLLPDPNIGNGVDKDAVIDLLSKAEGAKQFSVQNTAEAEEQAEARYQEQREADLERESQEYAEYVRDNAEYTQVDPETARLLTRALAVDEDAAISAASKEAPESEVQAALQQIIEAPKSEIKPETRRGEATAPQTDRRNQGEEAEESQAEEEAEIINGIWKPVQEVELGAVVAQMQRGPAKGKFAVITQGADGRWSMVAGRYRETIELAVEESGSYLDALEAQTKAQKNKQQAMGKLSNILRKGQLPNMSQWRAVFPGVRDAHTYLKQPEISPFLVKYFPDKGFTKGNIKKPLGKASGTLVSDTGAKYPIVYFDRLPDVLKDDSQGNDFALTDEVSPQQQTTDLETERDRRRSGLDQEEPAAATTGDDIFANQGQLEPDLFAGPQDNYAPMRGKEISYEVEVEDTGETYIVSVDAAETLEKLDTRIEALRQLRECI